MQPLWSKLVLIKLSGSNLENLQVPPKAKLFALFFFIFITDTLVQRTKAQHKTLTVYMNNSSILAWVLFWPRALLSTFCLWWESNLRHPIWYLLGSWQFHADCFQHFRPIESDYWMPFGYKAYLTSINLQGYHVWVPSRLQLVGRDVQTCDSMAERIRNLVAVLIPFTQGTLDFFPIVQCPHDSLVFMWFAHSFCKIL